MILRQRAAIGLRPALVEQVATQWVAYYTASFLADCEGEGAILAEQGRWCAWLKSQIDALAQRFQVHLREDEHFSTSATGIHEWWEEWIYAIFPSPTAQWLTDCKD
jgi:hypothetical protein